MTAEQQARLDDIHNGPWREKSEFARQRLPALSKSELETHLRDHRVLPITNPNEIELRESFDQVMEELQLTELAVACGFLPLDVVRPDAQHEFVTLLSSTPARNYIKLYDFVPVRYLAARLGIDLQIGPVQPPVINAHAEIRYAVFLATHYEFIANPQIRTFTMFIDDFYFRDPPNGRQFGAASLKRRVAGEQPGATSGEDAKLAEGTLGLIQFTETLGDLFIQIPEPEQRYFGLAYSYWLSHFFGLRRLQDRYEQQAISFEDVPFAPEVLVPDLDSQGAEAERKRFHDRVQTLRSVWNATRQLIETLDPPHTVTA
jgi:hypothetical protein